MNKFKPGETNKENRSQTPLTDRSQTIHSLPSCDPQYLIKPIRGRETTLLQTQLTALEKQHERLQLLHDHVRGEYAKVGLELMGCRKEVEIQKQASSRYRSKTD